MAGPPMLRRAMTRAIGRRRSSRTDAGRAPGLRSRKTTSLASGAKRRLPRASQAVLIATDGPVSTRDRGNTVKSCPSSLSIVRPAARAAARQLDGRWTARSMPDVRTPRNPSSRAGSRSVLRANQSGDTELATLITTSPPGRTTRASSVINAARSGTYDASPSADAASHTPSCIGSARASATAA